jgi:hypothetical protein
MLVRLIFTKKGEPYKQAIQDTYGFKIYNDVNRWDLSNMTREQFDSLQKAVDNDLLSRIILRP